MSYVPLHIHTEHSPLDGMARISDLVTVAVREGYPGIGISDHGSLSGAFQLWKECKQAGIVPIIGEEFYVAPASRHDKRAIYFGDGSTREDVGGRGAYTHLSVYAKNATGLRNLFKLHYEASATGAYYKPRIDRALLAEHRDGLIVLSGCLGSELQTRLKLGQYEQAEAYVEWAKDVFGDDFYIEIMDHGMDIEQEINPKLRELASHYDVKLVATADAHYVHEEEGEAHDAYLCVQTYAKVSDENRFRFNGRGYYVEPYDVMVEKHGETPVLNTIDIMEKVESYDEVFEPSMKFPKFDVEWSDEESARYLTHQVSEFVGNDAARRERAEMELDVITSMGYSDYFLVLADIVNWAKRQGIAVGPGRGSAAGSFVSYALGITDLDPLKHGLYFERFLNPERVSPPDIDTDFQDDRRHEVLNYARERYGHEFVAKVLTLGTMGAKRALLDSARVLGHPVKVGRDLVALLPRAEFGRQPSLAEAAALPDDPITQLARSFEGLVRGVGEHAAATIISPVRLPSALPCTVNKDGVLLTGVDAKAVDAMGFQKYDFLGLASLSVIEQAKAFAGVGLDWHAAAEDAQTYEMLAAGHTLGIFQFDGRSMQKLVKAIKPNELNDLSAASALHRPGPMAYEMEYAKKKQRDDHTVNIHPEVDAELENLLYDTYGIIVYQEQLMNVLRHFGYTLGQADVVRRIMGKKDRSQLEVAFETFKMQLRTLGKSDEAIQTLWDVLVPFADYAFNKSHSISYAYVSVMMAYLKAHHPVAFMAALLNKEDDPDKVREYLQECDRMRIGILPPDINHSGERFSPDGKNIRYGLAAIKGVGDKAYAALLKKRPYSDINDFYWRADKKALNANTLGALIKSGALDSLQPSRAAHLADSAHFATAALEAREQVRKGQGGLVRPKFGHVTPADDDNVEQYKRWESEILGVSLTVPCVTVTLQDNLDLDQWEWFANFCYQNRGTSPLELVLRSGDRVPVDVKVSSEALRSKLSAVMPVEVIVHG